MQMETQELQEAREKSTISVHGWTGNEDVTAVGWRLAVRDGRLPAAVLNDLCCDHVVDERWRRAVKYPILQVLNQACRLSKHTTRGTAGGGSAASARHSFKYSII